MFEATLPSSLFPFNTLSFVQTDGAAASAVQVGPNLWITAAHVVANTSGVRYTHPYVLPRYNVPQHSAAIPIAEIIIDNAYVSPTADRNAHDIAFLRTATSSPLPQFPNVYLISSTVDHERPADTLCHAGQLPYSDAWINLPANSQQSISWFPEYTPCWINPDPDVFILGYPEYANGSPNSNLVPYYSAGYLWGTSHFFSTFPYMYYYELVHTCSDCAPFIGSEAAVSGGYSGGPIYGFDHYYYKLLGIVTARNIPGSTSSNINSVGTGQYQYNYTWFQQNLQWNPSQLISISSPTTGSYTSSSIPPLIASAGLLADSLSWTSSIDGPLGTGSNISVANRLSVGTHTITATVGETSKSVEVIITAPPPSATFTPATATIPVGALVATAPFSIRYSCSCSSLDWWLSINSGAYQLRATTVGQGTYTDNISASTVYRYKIYPHSNITTLLGTPSVTGQIAASPSFNVTPTTVVVPATASSGNVVVTWNAPGYPALDWWGKINNGPWTGGTLTTPASGTTTIPIPVGTTYSWRFYPQGSANQGGTTNLLGTLTANAAAAPSPTFSANPTHIIVPANATSGNTVVTWNAPGYTALDWCGKTNNGPWECGSLTTPASGTTTIPVPVGTTYGWRFYPAGSPNQGGTANLLGSLTVSATH